MEQILAELRSEPICQDSNLQPSEPFSLIFDIPVNRLGESLSTSSEQANVPSLDLGDIVHTNLYCDTENEYHDPSQAAVRPHYSDDSSTPTSELTCSSSYLGMDIKYCSKRR